MRQYRIRFEQGRGHFMIVNREPSLTREHFDEFHIRMIQSCKVPGLLGMEAVHLDGTVSLRYALAGTRMLSQALRASKWSMTEMLGCVCRLAEILEDSRHYALDADRFVLSDDFIFVGDDWLDLRLVYLPVIHGGDHGTLNENIERLIVRWIMFVPQVDGATMQSLLRLAASDDFSLTALRAFARKTLAGSISSAKERQSDFQGVEERKPERRSFPLMEQSVSNASVAVGAASEISVFPSVREKRESWRWFQPNSDPHSLSGLLGDEPQEMRNGAAEAAAEKPHGALNRAGRGGEEQTRIRQREEIKRLRIWIVCGASIVTAGGWKWIYVGQSSGPGMWLASGLTLLAGAASLLLWNGFSNRGGRNSVALEAAILVDKPSLDDAVVPGGGRSRQIPNSESGGRHLRQLSMEEKPQNTVWLPTQEAATEQLGQRNSEGESQVYYLEWESEGRARIALQGESLVIGKSREAARHIDESKGVSRVHLELVRAAEGWMAKDLGSRNGSTLNDVPMAPYQLYPLSPEDCLEMGKSRYRFRTKAALSGYIP
ncbi:DUF6382 domain-containing protein [Cohnella faecalis]|uniref:DUF6382 domain-containing protein n=1 Tax=Cohnella faecalis TaxID=2315694 RepID=UPI0036145DF2